MNIETIINTFTPAVEKFGGFPEPVKFRLGPDHVIHIHGQDISTQDKEANCTLSMSIEVFEKIVNAEIDPMGAVMEGDIDVEGDSAIAISIQGLF
ncbi:sterol carrier protein [Pseudomaricurvus alkylphenolicus]|uniref:SCP2 sterol-binding domain-containing protein n=1 Tax=Pseudomaricurvus alkylphenolicus TaxID=1306991 RepID=UPI00141E6A54|nr:SCP2 sterol-binding domain-containing protein [Pseudomaricurvus alkylphenolicus]NIB43527.1 sterol carrier protein [Pseudomaricurvus alkylphenolicus]